MEEKKVSKKDTKRKISEEKHYKGEKQNTKNVPDDTKTKGNGRF